MKQGKTLKKSVFWTVYILVIAACIAIDQLSKYFIGKAVNSSGSINIIGKWLTFTWTVNTGATGGIFSNLSWRNILFFVMTVIGLPIFILMLKRSRTRSVWGQVAFAFITGGTIGNAIDRLAFAREGFFTGGVRDFIKVEGFFGIFNFADSFLVVGVIMAMLAVLFFDYDSLVNVIIEERCVKRAEKKRTEALSKSDAADSQTAEEQPQEDKTEQTVTSDTAVGADEKNRID